MFGLDLKVLDPSILLLYRSCVMTSATIASHMSVDLALHRNQQSIDHVCVNQEQAIRISLDIHHGFFFHPRVALQDPRRS